MIQTYEDLMLPVLLTIKDGNTYRNRDIQQKVSTLIGLTEEEMREVLPSGRQNVYKSRTNWAITYLMNAGLVERISRGVFRISAEGKTIMQAPPQKIDNIYLMQFPAFRAWVNFSDTTVTRDSIQLVNEETPEDQIEKAFEKINKTLAEDLLTEILNNDSHFFERLVVKLLVKMGYGDLESAQVVGQSGDDGVDGIINSDKLGFEKIYIQAKRYAQNNSVGNELIRNFSGALVQHGATKGVLITTSSFTPKAIEAVRANTQQRIILIDGKKLTNFMIEYNLGVSEINHYSIKKIDTDFFDEA
ncbi:MAG: restriction endonuclease [Clostridia bacterium]|nr:restriction endonuclease [Clostridia bacterium]